ncbi:MAG: hypothetical protein JWR56_727 [Massilia sp.]|nr:hypothetical protein [Massilia sp.]
MGYSLTADFIDDKAYMIIEEISSAADGQSNEDLIAIFESEAFTDIVIMDGGSSVADRAYIDGTIGDAAWFVTSFSRSLKKAIDAEMSQEESVSSALKEVFVAFKRKSGGSAIPLYAYPVAAMTWVRVAHINDIITLQIYCIGDCKTLLLRPDQSVIDLDPYVNPQELILQSVIAKLSSDGVADSLARRERLLPMLRARREFMNSTASPPALCLDPCGPFDARTYTVGVEQGSTLLAMTDGFYRLVDSYKICSNDELANMCSRNGLALALKRLRDFEAAVPGSAALSVKSADDASAVTCMFS